MNAWPSSTPPERPPARSSSMPTRAAWRKARDLREAYRKALACDPVSAFGGIVALNRPLDAETARGDRGDLHRGHHRAGRRTRRRVAIVAAKKNLRLLIAGGLPDPRAPGLTFKIGRRRHAGADPRQRDGGRHATLTLGDQARADGGRARRPAFAFRVAKHVKSNAIVYAKDGATVGIGAGQMSRVDSARIAARKAADAAPRPGLPAPLTGSVVASDAFFPFADGLLVASKRAPRP